MTDLQLVLRVLMAIGIAIIISFLATPLVKALAYKVGAIDVPKDGRRMHKTPIPRLGGLPFPGLFGSVLSCLPRSTGR